MRTRYVPDIAPNTEYITTLYALSRSKYARSLAEVKQSQTHEQKETLKRVESFVEPIL